MKTLFTSCFGLSLLLTFLQVNGQDVEQQRIDSLANVPIADVISNSSELIPIYRKNAEKARAKQMLQAEAKSYNHIRLMYLYLGRYDSSRFYIIKAIQTFEKGGFKKEAAYLHCERGYAMKRDNLEKAEKEMQLGIATLKEINDKLQLAGVYNNYGVIKEFKKEYDSAQHYYQLSLDYKYELNDTVGIPYSILNLGVLAGLQKDYQRATDSVKKAILLFDKANNLPTEAESIFELAEIYARTGNLAQAKKYFQECIKLSTSVSYLRLLKECHKKLATLYETTGNLKQSLFHQRAYNRIHDSLINETRVKEISQLETQFEVAKKEERIAKQRLKIQARDNQMLLGLIGVVLLAFGVFYYIKRLRFKKKLEKIAYENKMRRERERISRDLHDNIGSQLAFIISGAGIKQENQDEQLAQIASFAKDTLDQLRTTVWAIKKEKISVEDFAEQVEGFIEKIKPNSLIEFKFERDLPHDVSLGPTQSVHLFRVIQESISNAIKHSDCYSISIILRSKGNLLNIIIQDDGKGFDPTNNRRGNGLQFMQQRLEELGGHIDITSSDKGTTVSCELNTTFDV